jgi:hypothetical protein
MPDNNDSASNRIRLDVCLGAVQAYLKTKVFRAETDIQSMTVGNGIVVGEEVLHRWERFKIEDKDQQVASAGI